LISRHDFGKRWLPVVGWVFVIGFGCGPGGGSNSPESFRIVALAGGSGAGRLYEIEISEDVPVENGRKVSSIPWLVGGIESGFGHVVVGSRLGHTPRVIVGTNGKAQALKLEGNREFVAASISVVRDAWLTADSTGISVYSFSGSLESRLERRMHPFQMPLLEITEERVAWYIDEGNRLVALDFRSDEVLAAKPLPPPKIKNFPSGGLRGSCGEFVFVSRLGRMMKCRLVEEGEGAAIQCKRLSGWAKRVGTVTCCSGVAVALKNYEFPTLYSEFRTLDGGPIARIDGGWFSDLACVESGYLQDLEIEAH
jgi:hypothetical protein